MQKISEHSFSYDSINNVSNVSVCHKEDDKSISQSTTMKVASSWVKCKKIIAIEIIDIQETLNFSHIQCRTQDSFTSKLLLLVWFSTYSCSFGVKLQMSCKLWHQMATWLRALNGLPLLKLSWINKGILIKKQQDFENVLAYNKEQYLCPENGKIPLSPTF